MKELKQENSPEMKGDTYLQSGSVCLLPKGWIEKKPHLGALLWNFRTPKVKRY